MKIEYHPHAWQCPECNWWTAVSRYKVGSHVRKCCNTNCKIRVRVKIKKIEQTRRYLEKVIIVQPVRE